MNFITGISRSRHRFSGSPSQIAKAAHVEIDLFALTLWNPLMHLVIAEETYDVWISVQHDNGSANYSKMVATRDQFFEELTPLIYISSCFSRFSSKSPSNIMFNGLRFVASRYYGIRR